MGNQAKTDNRSLALKVELRRRALARAGLASARVLDLFAGEGHVWREMRKHVNITSYAPCDREPRLPGCVKGEAERLVLAFDLSRFDVIDIDTYGEPWACWLSAARRRPWCC